MNTHVPAAAIDLSGHGHYLTWSFLQISVANLVMIGLIAAAFTAALFLPFPGRRGGDGDDD